MSARVGWVRQVDGHRNLVTCHVSRWRAPQTHARGTHPLQPYTLHGSQGGHVSCTGAVHVSTFLRTTPCPFPYIITCIQLRCCSPTRWVHKQVLSCCSYCIYCSSHIPYSTRDAPSACSHLRTHTCAELVTCSHLCIKRHASCAGGLMRVRQGTTS